MTIANPTQVRQLPPPEEQEFSVFEPRIQELGEKDRLAWQAQAQAQQEKNQAWQAQQERSNMQSEHTAVVSKRPAIEFDGRETPHSKRRKETEEESQVEEITLEDSDEEQDKAVRVNAATREPGPSQGHQPGHQSSSNTCLTQTQTPAALARLKSLPITVVGEVALSASGTDSEDDIQVTVIKKM